MNALLLLGLRGYRYFLSPLLGNQCRFAPTCSLYAIEAVERFGAWRGGALALRRLARCHPWNPGGWDPVPGADGASAVSKAAKNCGCGSVDGHP